MKSDKRFPRDTSKRHKVLKKRLEQNIANSTYTPQNHKWLYINSEQRKKKKKIKPKIIVDPEKERNILYIHAAYLNISLIIICNSKVNKTSPY